MNRITDFMNDEYDPIADMIADIVDQIREVDSEDEVGEILYNFYYDTVDETRKQIVKNLAMQLMEQI